MNKTLGQIDAHKYNNDFTSTTMSASRNKKDLVNFSVRAQDFILKRGIRNYSTTVDTHSINPRTTMGGGSFATNNDVVRNNFLDTASPSEESFD
jgi:hypothetical protein